MLSTDSLQAESEEARYLKQMLIAMGFPKPPEGITAFQLFSKVETKVQNFSKFSVSSVFTRCNLASSKSKSQFSSLLMPPPPPCAAFEDYVCLHEGLICIFCAHCVV